MTKSQNSALVLGEDFAYEPFADYLKQAGWTRHSKQDRAGDALEEVWSNQEQTEAIHYVDAPRMRTKYLVVRGSKIATTVSELAKRFFTYGTDELFEKVESAEVVDDVVLGLMRLAVAYRKGFDEEVLATFRHFSEADAAPIRRAVVQSVLFTGWPQGRPLLQQMSSVEKVADVRTFIDEAVAAMDHGKPGVG